MTPWIAAGAVLLAFAVATGTAHALNAAINLGAAALHTPLDAR